MIRSIKGDCLESIFFNLQMAIQKCIDIVAHIISEESYGVPGSTAEMFSLLGEKRILDGDITEKMVKAVGLRNLIVHEYGGIELKQVFDVAQKGYKRPKRIPCIDFPEIWFCRLKLFLIVRYRESFIPCGQ